MYGRSAHARLGGYSYNFVIRTKCGHIHIPQKRQETREGHTIYFMNSGDWVESLTALEYSNAQWTLYQHDPNSAIKEEVQIRVNHREGEFLEPLRRITGIPAAQRQVQ